MTDSNQLMLIKKNSLLFSNLLPGWYSHRRNLARMCGAWVVFIISERQMSFLIRSDKSQHKKVICNTNQQVFVLQTGSNFGYFQVVICFGIAIKTQLYVGYAIVSLLVEVNSVFLHLRQLLQISKIDQRTVIYRMNSLLNLGKRLQEKAEIKCFFLNLEEKKTRYAVISVFRFRYYSKSVN